MPLGIGVADEQGSVSLVGQVGLDSAVSNTKITPPFPDNVCTLINPGGFLASLGVVLRVIDGRPLSTVPSSHAVAIACCFLASAVCLGVRTTLRFISNPWIPGTAA